MGGSKVAKSYQNFLRGFRGQDKEHAMQVAIGGEFEAFGVLERELLIQYGLRPDGYAIDVGCGSGRLAKALTSYLEGPYLGIDVVPEFVEHARALVDRPDWRFEVTAGVEIPEQDGVADIVCFFSVFTHLLHEHSYAYLREAKRVLKPGGRAVFSFLEFKIPSHWAVFDSTLAEMEGDDPINVFIGRDGINAWAAHLEMPVIGLHDGDKPHTPLPEPIALDNGTVMADWGNLGQSVCVLERP
jgi:SAM-dependent methyltransferase